MASLGSDEACAVLSGGHTAVPRPRSLRVHPMRPRARPKGGCATCESRAKSARTALSTSSMDGSPPCSLARDQVEAVSPRSSRSSAMSPVGRTVTQRSSSASTRRAESEQGGIRLRLVRNPAASRASRQPTRRSRARSRRSREPGPIRGSRAASRRPLDRLVASEWGCFKAIDWQAGHGQMGRSKTRQRSAPHRLPLQSHGRESYPRRATQIGSPARGTRETTKAPGRRRQGGASTKCVGCLVWLCTGVGTPPRPARLLTAAGRPA
jgi:hypothetical protein